jgi:dipeptidyl aminopeptidase/acylaminoacyl peptidase
MVPFVAWNSDDSRIVTAHSDGSARIWDVSSGQQILTLRGNADGLHHVAWSSDNSRILTVSWNGNAEVWDAVTGQELLTLSDPIGAVAYATWSSDDSRIVTANWDGEAKIHIVDVNILVDFACGQIDRNMTYDEWNLYMGSDLRYRKTCPSLPMPQLVSYPTERFTDSGIR